MGVGNWFSCRETRNERNGKMIRINQIKLTPDKGKEELVQKAAKILRISEKEILSLKIRKQSTDARKKPNIMYVYTVDVEVSNEQKIMRRQKGNQVTLIHETPYDFPNSGTKKMEHRPVVIGSGPAGLFCAYLLAEHGYRPVVYERGASVEERKKRCGTILERTGSESKLQRTVRRRRCRNIFRWKTKYTCQRSNWKEPESAGNLCGKRCAKGHPVQS